MKTITQIIGLPRSRTAWLSVVLTYGSSVGLHDAVGLGSPSVREYLSVLNSFEAEHVSDCSSALILRHDLIDAAGGPIILIRRNKDDARASFARHIRNDRLVDSSWDGIIESFDMIARNFPGRIALEVEFKDLSDSGVIKSIFDIAAPSCLFDLDRINRLQRLNIQEIYSVWD